MNILITIIAIILLIIVLLIYLGNFAFRLALTRGDAKMQQKLPGRLQDYPNNGWLDTNTEKVTIVSNDGLELAGYCKDHGTGKFAILCHGYRGDHYMLDLPTQRFYEMGYGVLTLDARAHGASQGEYICMGWNERRDVIQWCRKLMDDYGQDIQIVLYGVSMGAATVMLAGGEADLPSNVKCIVEDCGFSDMWSQGAALLKFFYSLPAFPVLNLIDSVCKRKAHYSLKEINCTEHLKKCRTPILFIHGALDKFVPFPMRDVLYEAAAGPKQKETFEKAAHAQSFKTEPERYYETIQKFTERYCL